MYKTEPESRASARFHLVVPRTTGRCLAGLPQHIITAIQTSTKETPMKLSTVKAMIAKAKKNGHMEIVYNGMSSGGLYSSSSCRVPVFLTKYPEDPHESPSVFQDCLKSVGKSIDDFLDTIEVHDGFLEVTINHLAIVDKSEHRDDRDELECSYARNGQSYTRTYHRAFVALSHYTYSGTGWTDKNGERFHTILIPFENIISIVC
jgi:hypothetical protein